jgi:hypothetical protein
MSEDQTPGLPFAIKAESPPEKNLGLDNKNLWSYLFRYNEAARSAEEFGVVLSIFGG